MKIEMLISTINQKNFYFLDKMGILCDALVINQNTLYEEEYRTSGANKIRIINTPEKGLSNSRNMLLKNAIGDICILCDDDLEYFPDYISTIEDAYKKYPQADIITFLFTEKIGKDTRKRYKKDKKLQIFDVSHVASVEITFKRKSICDKKLQFDKLLGLGSYFPSGEENAFLVDALKAGLSIIHIPKTICYAKPDTSRLKWVKGFNENYFNVKGASFYRIYKHLFLPFCLAFILLKKWNIFKHVPFLLSIKWMLKGRRDYIDLNKKALE